MNDGRWHQVKALFQSAIELAASERDAFLTACAQGDAALRSEVESLLRCDISDQHFSERLPFLLSSSRGRTPGRATVFEDASAQISAGSVIGQYRVMGVLGTGGMGEVFRAHDARLNRQVALKVLPARFADDPDRLARFRREAQALAALNHPHIAAIYGLEESDGYRALVLELVEGPTLAERICDGPLSAEETLRLADQIGQALQAAHERGIIHRDLKPANIKLTPGGLVKVLDFGVAKIAGGDLQPGTLPEDRSAIGSSTHVGAIVGTAGYMSPEQARGDDVDARSDIWAFGCVVIEMLTGTRAFSAATSAGITEILRREPWWAAFSQPALPAGTGEVINRCLRPALSERWQTIAEARAALECLKATDVGKRSRRSTAGAAAAAILAVSAAIYLWSIDSPARVRSDWERLTNLDSVTHPALSPDGRTLAFIRGPSTFVSSGELHVKPLPDGDPIRLTGDGLPKMGPVFSPDGQRIAYTVNDGGSWDTWDVDVVKGTPRRWLRNASGLTWMPDGALLFSEIKRGLQMAIVSSDRRRTTSRDIYVPATSSGMAHRSHRSPDGRWTLVVEMDDNGAWMPCRLVSADADSSRVVGPSPARCTSAAWAPDGRWMYFSADTGEGFHIWRQRFPDGPLEQVTSGPTEEEGLAVAPDGLSLITSVGVAQRSVWLHDAAGERQVSFEGYAFWPLISADGRYVCFRVTRGPGTGQTPSELWVIDVRSGQRLRLFPQQLVTGYDVSHDNRVVASVPEVDGKTGLWLTSLDGSGQPRRIPGADGDSPRFGPRGEILFRAAEAKTAFLHRIEPTGEGRVRIGELGGAVLGTVSPDGRWVTGPGVDNAAMMLYSTRGDPPIRLFPPAQTSRLRWSADGAFLYFQVQYAEASAFAFGRTYVLPLSAGSVLPAVEPGGFRTEAEVAAFPGAQMLPYGDLAPGPSPGIYAFSRVTTTRNLFRIPLK